MLVIVNHINFLIPVSKAIQFTQKRIDILEFTFKTGTEIDLEYDIIFRK